LNDNNTVENTEINPVHYYFSFSYSDQGIVLSKLTVQETRDKLNRELAALFGPEGVTVTDFRVATEAEAKDYDEALAERMALTTEELPPVVIN
jgi:hypothetical protein